MRKSSVFMAATAFLALSLAFTPAQAADSNYKMGPYVGGYGGFDWTNADISGGPTAHLNGGDYGAFAGFSVDSLLKNTLGIGLSGAVEGEYGWSGASKTSAFGGGTKIDKDHEWGLSFRPGLTFLSSSDTLGLKPYGIFGYRQGDFKIINGGGSSSKSHPGFDLGIGTEVIAFQNVGVRLDYDHVFYRDGGGIDPDENDLRAGLVYHF